MERANVAKKSASVASSEILYQVRAVTKHRLVVCKEKKKPITTFKVLWEGYDVKHATWEPLANLVNCPQFILDLAKDWEEEHQKLAQTTKRPPIPGIFDPYMKVPCEYKPDGTEKPPIINGLTTINRDQFYLVRFRGEKCLRTVRAPFLEYHFPLECVMYLKKREVKIDEMNAQIRQKAESDREKKLVAQCKK